MIKQERFVSEFCALTRRGFAVILDVLPQNQRQRDRSLRKEPL